MKTSPGALLAAMSVAALAAAAVALNYKVGGDDGWDTYVNYDQWVAGKTFMVGDTITFKYMPYHNVLEVTAASYDSCTADGAISTHSGGATTFELAAAGTRYFICGIPHHCLNGTMHVKVTTVPYSAAAAAAAATAAAGPAPAGLPADGYMAPSPSADKHLMAAAPTSAASVPRFQRPAAATTAAVAGVAVAALMALVA